MTGSTESCDFDLFWVEKKKDCFYLQRGLSTRVLVLLVFTLGLPSMIGHYLWVHWGNELYSTSVVQRVGFLYSAYNRGAEFWQIHDVIMKMRRDTRRRRRVSSSALGSEKALERCSMA